MPAVFISGCSRLKEILHCLPALHPHNWLISELTSYDYYGWGGCEKWAEETLFLLDNALRRDIDSRDPQIIWGAFSATPIHITKEQAYAYALPWLDGNSDYMKNHILPQHPLALLEIAVFDGSYTTVSARDASLLEPLYALPYSVRDEEADNQKLNANLRRIHAALRGIVPHVTEEQANEVQWICWRSLFRDVSGPVDDGELFSAVREAFGRVSASGYQCRYSPWNPFHAD